MEKINIFRIETIERKRVVQIKITQEMVDQLNEAIQQEYRKHSSHKELETKPILECTKLILEHFQDIVNQPTFPEKFELPFENEKIWSNFCSGEWRTIRDVVKEFIEENIQCADVVPFKLVERDDVNRP